MCLLRLTTYVFPGYIVHIRFSAATHSRLPLLSPSLLSLLPSLASFTHTLRSRHASTVDSNSAFQSATITPFKIPPALICTCYFCVSHANSNYLRVSLFFTVAIYYEKGSPSCCHNLSYRSQYTPPPPPLAPSTTTMTCGVHDFINVLRVIAVTFFLCFVYAGGAMPP